VSPDSWSIIPESIYRLQFLTALVLKFQVLWVITVLADVLEVCSTSNFMFDPADAGIMLPETSEFIYKSKCHNITEDMYLKN
jgi:hypothetical protein